MTDLTQWTKWSVFIMIPMFHNIENVMVTCVFPAYFYKAISTWMSPLNCPLKGGKYTLLHLCPNQKQSVAANKPARWSSGRLVGCTPVSYQLRNCSTLDGNHIHWPKLNVVQRVESSDPLENNTWAYIKTFIQEQCNKTGSGLGWSMRKLFCWFYAETVYLSQHMAKYINTENRTQPLLALWAYGYYGWWAAPLIIIDDTCPLILHCTTLQCPLQVQYFTLHPQEPC